MHHSLLKPNKDRYTRWLDRSGRRVMSTLSKAREIFTMVLLNWFLILWGNEHLSVFGVRHLICWTWALQREMSCVVRLFQLPLFDVRSDGRSNFASSLIIAGCYPIPEVAVMFGSHLFRGNRTVKSSSNDLNAFESPNCPPLATIGVEIQGNQIIFIIIFIISIIFRGGPMFSHIIWKVSARSFHWCGWT